MPTVPGYQPQVSPEALPQARVSTEAPLEAFGGGQTKERAEQATQGAFSSIQDVIQEQKQKADQMVYLDSSNKASQLQTQIQVQTSKMLGKDAFQAPDYAQKAWQDGIQEIQQGLSNDQQRLSVSRDLNTRWDELNKTVQLHVASQAESYHDQLDQSAKENNLSAAALNAFDDDRVDMEKARTDAVLRDQAQRKGIPLDSPIFQAQSQAAQSQINSAVIQARLDAGKDDAAKEFYDDHKDELTASDQVRAIKLLENAEIKDKSLEIWSKLRGMNLSDGQPDEARMERAVYAAPGLSVEQKDKVWEFVKARANEAYVQKRRQDYSDDRDFMNDLLTARKNGEPMDEALDLVNDRARDAYDQSLKTQLVQQVYAPPSKSNPQVYMDLWEKVTGGAAAKTEIDAALKRGDINTSDWQSLTKEDYRNTLQGQDPKTKDAWDRVKIMGRDAGYSGQDLAKFQYVLKQENDGKPPEQIIKAAQDKLKGDPNTGFWGAFQTPQWKSDLQRIDAESTAWGKLYDDVGKDQVNAIGQGALRGGASKWGPADIDLFAQSLGGYGKIKAGTPANDAIQSLINHKRAVTPGTVQRVLERYPDGKWP